MSLYRCHFLNTRDRIESSEEIEAATLFDAMDRANAMLKERSHHDAVEVWAGNRSGRVTDGSTARGGRRTQRPFSIAHYRSFDASRRRRLRFVPLSNDGNRDFTIFADILAFEAAFGDREHWKIRPTRTGMHPRSLAIRVSGAMSDE
jgi:hypothetical protein